MAIDYTQSYVSTWMLSRLDPLTWVPVDKVERLFSFSLDKDGTDSVPLLETGNAEIGLTTGEEFVPGWYQLSMIVEQPGTGYDIEPIATLWFESAKGTVTGENDKVSIDGKSVLYPASTTMLSAGSYAPKGVDGAAHCGKLLRGCGPAPVHVEGSFTLDDYYVFGEETSVLEAVWMLLDAGGFCIQLDGDGAINIRPKPSDPSLVVNRQTAAILGASYDYTFDRSTVHNVYIAVEGSSRAIAVNDDPFSPTSTVSRGFEVAMVDTSPIRVNGETLQTYAERKLMEERTSVERILVYNREYWPGVEPFSIVRWHTGDGYPQDLTVKSQTLTIGNGILVKETAVAYVEE